MIFCGVDMIEVSRIEKSILNPRFLETYFSNEERALFHSRKQNIQVIAGNFAAKEAFVKALGTGFRGISLAEISVLRNELGAPYYKLSGEANRLFHEKNVEYSLSISNTKEHAIAMVVMQSKTT